jgi:hypothetical protein
VSASAEVNARATEVPKIAVKISATIQAVRVGGNIGNRRHGSDIHFIFSTDKDSLFAR